MFKQKILLKDWAQFHPYVVGGKVDIEYVRVANRVYDAYKKSVLGGKLSEENRKFICCGLTAYLEDCVCQTGFWKAFIDACRERYHTSLPFYEIDEEAYLDDEINFEDVAFLLWHYLQSMDAMSRKVVLSPCGAEILETAKAVYEVLDEEFEQVPVSERFRDYCLDIVENNDFFDLQTMLVNLKVCSFLFAPYIDSTSIFAKELIEGNRVDYTSYFDVVQYLRETTIFDMPSCFMGIHMHQWLARMLGKEHPAYDDLMNIHYVDGYFKFQGYKEENLVLRSMTADEEFLVFDKLPEDIKSIAEGDILLANMVAYRGEYYFISSSKFSLEEANLQMNMKKEEEEHHQWLYERFTKACKGKALAYFDNTKDAIKFLRDKLGFEMTSEIKTSIENAEKRAANLVVFVTKENGLQVISDAANCIKDKDNPFYDPEKAAIKGLALFLQFDSYPYPFYKYLLDNDMLPEARLKTSAGIDFGRKLFEKNQDFFVWYYRANEIREGMRREI